MADSGGKTKVDKNIKGSANNDNLFGDIGDNIIDGGKGIDTAIFTGKYASYVLGIPTGVENKMTVSGQDGNDLVLNTEFLQFDDGRYDVLNRTFIPKVVHVPNTISVVGNTVTEGDGQKITFTITRSGDISKAYTVDYVGSFAPQGGDGDMLKNGDLVIGGKALEPWKITFAPGSDTALVTFQVVNDKLGENAESMHLTVTTRDSFYTPVGSLTATATVVDNDGGISVPTTYAVSDAADVNEGQALAFTVSSSKAVTADTIVTTDHGNVTILAGQTSAVLTVQTDDNVIHAPNPDVVVKLTGAFGTDTGTGHVLDNDVVTVAFEGWENEVTEGAPATLNFKLSNPSNEPVVINYHTVSGSADGSDYVSIKAGTATVPAGESLGQIVIDTTQDGFYEERETFSVVIDSVTGANLGTTPAALNVTIVDDEAAPAYSIGDAASRYEGGTLEFLVSSTIPVATDTVVTTDHGNVTILAGQTSALLTVETTENTMHGSNPDVVVKLTGTFGTDTGTGHVLDNDPAPVLIISLDSLTGRFEEGQTVTYGVRLMNPSSEPVTFDYSIQSPLATPGIDYADLRGTYTFAPGQTEGAITIPIYKDGINEPRINETLVLAVRNVTGATLSGDLIDKAFILDMDPSPIVSIAAETSVTEGDTATIKFSLAGPSQEDVSVFYETVVGSAGESDYTPVEGVAIVKAGQTTGSFTINTAGDSLIEGNEHFSVQVGAQNADVPSFLGMIGVTILDDDVRADPQVSVSASSEVTEGQDIIYTATLLNGAVDHDITVDFDLPGVVVGETVHDGKGYIRILAGETTGTATLATLDDAKHEADDTLVSRFYTPPNVTLVGPDTASTVVHDNDPVPTLTYATSVSASEGDPATVNLTLSGLSSEDVVVSYRTVHGSANGFDYTQVSAGGTTIIKAGETSGSIVIATHEDQEFESDESFTVEITGVTTAQLSADATPVVVTILNDDARPTPAIGVSASAQATEGGAITYTATLANGPTDHDVRAFYNITSGASDVVATQGTITIQAGQTSGSATLNTVDDTIFEGDEFIRAVFSTEPGTNLVGLGGAQTILHDNDPLPVLSVTTASVSEGAAQGIAFVDIHLDRPSSTPVSFDYSLDSGTATRGVDFGAVQGSVRFSPGQTDLKVVIPMNNDTFIEPHETLLFTPSAIQGAAPFAPVSIVIKDDDAIHTADFAPGIQSFLGTAAANETLYFDQPYTGSISLGGGGIQGGAFAGSTIDKIENLTATLDVSALVTGTGETNILQVTSIYNGGQGSTVNGLAGDDTIVFVNNGASISYVSGDVGNDRVTVSGLGLTYVLDGNSPQGGNDMYVLGSGSQILQTLGIGLDTVTGFKSGEDKIDFTGLGNTDNVFITHTSAGQTTHYEVYKTNAIGVTTLTGTGDIDGNLVQADFVHNAAGWHFA